MGKDLRNYSQATFHNSSWDGKFGEAALRRNLIKFSVWDWAAKEGKKPFASSLLMKSPKLLTKDMLSSLTEEEKPFPWHRHLRSKIEWKSINFLVPPCTSEPTSLDFAAPPQNAKKMQIRSIQDDDSSNLRIRTFVNYSRAQFRSKSANAALYDLIINHMREGKLHL